MPKVLQAWKRLWLAYASEEASFRIKQPQSLAVLLAEASSAGVRLIQLVLPSASMLERKKDSGMGS
jgi:hypothetical protein